MANKHPDDARFIKSREWRDTHRRLALMRNPLCRHCEWLGRVTAATQVDHVIVPNGDFTLQRDPANMMSLCAEHHSIKTRKQVQQGKPHLIGRDDEWRMVFSDGSKRGTPPPHGG
jgi:5-methylcytosine-specific restriction endonuclease McrA